MTAADAQAERLSDGTLVASRDSPVGGQAVLEGVMMRGVSTWAVAVRKPAADQIAGGRKLDPREPARGEIEIQSFPLVSVLKRNKALRWPVVRGVVALGESLKIGFTALQISANAQSGGEEQEISRRQWASAVVLGLSLAVGLFFLLPAALASIIDPPSGAIFVVIEKILRIGIFMGYIFLVSRMRELRRVFEYHGAEHKTISCYEAGQELTPENAQRFSRLHPRCGTSFMLIVMIVSIFVFAPFGQLDWYYLYPSRVLGIPLVAGLAFEAIKWFGRNRSKRWARVLMLPGMKLQLLTTREPDHEQLAVAIAAMNAVLAVETPGEASDEDRIGMEVVA